MSVGDADPAAVVASLRRNVDGLQALSAQRASIEEGLKEMKQRDNILPKLMAVNTSGIDALFAQVRLVLFFAPCFLATRCCCCCLRLVFHAPLLALPNNASSSSLSCARTITTHVPLPLLVHRDLPEASTKSVTTRTHNAAATSRHDPRPPLHPPHTHTQHAQEIKKYDPLKADVAANVGQQQQLLAAVHRDNGAFRTIFDVDGWGRACEAAAAGVRGSAKVFRELLDHLSEGLRFYIGMQVRSSIVFAVG